MNTQNNNYKYLVLVLWGSMIVLLAVVIGLAKKKDVAVADVYKKTAENISDCRLAVADWDIKYAPADIVSKKETRVELASVLNNCEEKIDSAKRYLSQN